MIFELEDRSWGPQSRDLTGGQGVSWSRQVKQNSQKGTAGHRLWSGRWALVSLVKTTQVTGMDYTRKWQSDEWRVLSHFVTQNLWQLLSSWLQISPGLCALFVSEETVGDYLSSSFALWLTDGLKWGAMQAGGREESEISAATPIPFPCSFSKKAEAWSKNAWPCQTVPFHIAHLVRVVVIHMYLGLSQEPSPGTILGCCIIHFRNRCLLTPFQITPFEYSVSELSFLRLRLNSLLI